MKNIKRFEDFVSESYEMKNEKFFGFGKDKGEKKKRPSGSGAYKNTIEFLEGDSDEAKKVMEYYNEYIKGKEDSELRKDSVALRVIAQITRLGAKWAKDNKMTPKDYNYSNIRTVLEEKFDRKFHGGGDLTIGESLKNRK